MTRTLPVSGIVTGSVIGTLYATDEDGDRVTYSVARSDYLAADADTGEVTLTAPLDREVSKTMVLSAKPWFCFHGFILFLWL